MADAQASGACGRKIVWVQVPSPAFFFYCLSFKNASAFLLRDARHAMHDILLLRISAILPEAISDGGGLTPLLILIYCSPPTKVGVISHLIYKMEEQS
mgnify:CR=1 FL=1